ncbi:MAG: ATP-binding protein [Planctomycetota bacterium]
MMPPAEPPVLVHSPVASDTDAITRLLEGDHLAAQACNDLDDLAHRCTTDCGCLVLTSEALLNRDKRPTLRAAIDTAAGPARMPVLLLTGNPVSHIAARVAAAILGQSAIVHSLERPVTPSELVTTVRDAVNVRQHTLKVAAEDPDLRLDELLGFGLLYVDQTQQLVLNANPVAHRQLGCQPETLTGRPLQDPPLDRLAPALERLLDEGLAQQTAIEHHGHRLRAFLCRHHERIAILLQDCKASQISPSNAFLSELMESHLAMLAHDMKGPLRQSLMWQDLLAEGDLTEQQRDLLGRGSRSLQRLIELIDHSLGRSKNGQPASCDPAQVLAAIREDLSQDITESQASLAFDDLPPAVPISAADLSRVLQNLIHNAIRYRSQHPPAIRVTGRSDATGTVLHITDNGIGIEAGLLPYIFRHGKLGRSGTSRGGKGLGLAICRDLVTRAGGRIWAEATVDEGSTFTIELPAVVQREPA